MIQLEGELATSLRQSYRHSEGVIAWGTRADCGSDGNPPWQLIQHGDDVIAALSVDQTEGRARLGLAFFGGDRIVDVSIQPGAWVGRIRQSASRFGANPDRWEAEIRRELLSGGSSEGWWTPASVDPESLDLVGLAARSAWPLLRHCTDDVREIPRWATGLLRGPDPVSAVRRQFHTRASRPLIRAVAQQLSGSVDWWTLACVLACHSLDADRSARLLDPIEEAASPTHVCSVEQFRMLERLLGDQPPATVLRFLRSADEGGPRRILRSLDQWRRAADRVGEIPPTVAEAERRIIAMGEPRPATMAIPASAPVAEPVIDLVASDVPELLRPLAASGEREPWQRARHAPRAGDVEIPTAFDHSMWDRAYHRERHGRVDLLLPADPAHLVEWSRLLRNCLDDYVPAVAARQCTVLAVRVDEVIVGAVEVDPTGRVRQLMGPANRPLASWVDDAVMGIVRKVNSA